MVMKSVIVLLGFTAILSCQQPQKQETKSEDTTTAITNRLPPPNPDKNCYFGDLHLHTTYSFDAFTLGTVTKPDQSYRYAIGEAQPYFGELIKRIEPLDFLAVTDHAEYLGAVRQTADSTSPIYNSALGRQLRGAKNISERLGIFNQVVSALFSVPPKTNPDLQNNDVIKSAWKDEIKAANDNYKPGRFTTFIGFEWTSAPNHQNIHRCVIFPGSTAPEKPYSVNESDKPEDLWTYMENWRKSSGSDVLAVPHNGNISNGLMFDSKDSYGNPLSREYAERRMMNEPLTEAAQGKGQSETHPVLSPNDEFANFELYEVLLNSTIKGKLDGSYIRQAWGNGMALQQKIGANPFKYGLEGGSDYHGGYSSSEENNYPGSHGAADATPQIRLQSQEGAGEPPIKVSAGCVTGVWAEKNTRESIFAGLKKKETFATSGPLIKVRFFGGWNLPTDMTSQADWVKQAYTNAVPMGSDLAAKTAESKSPSFAVWAMKDANSGNLDRIQIVKVWVKNGKEQEKVFDMVWSGERKKDSKTGKVSAVGNTVDIKTATYQNTIGSTELKTVWSDPEFDADVPACYYVRVIEIPTPRWSTYDAARNNLPLNTTVASTIQERAWTSPIWYMPTGKK
ncbi:MAG: hypothetical protein C5B59_01830 [Bacteroidetes bacterium]|nr:MAG: hypothetical protein C5B59_01830 [Bacteroidota bacterium]